MAGTLSGHLLRAELMTKLQLRVPEGPAVILDFCWQGLMARDEGSSLMAMISIDSKAPAAGA
eukprot:1161517-Pelagomonas_calceolata.AAC.13